MSNKARTQFECDGVAFDVGRLNLNESCRGLELLTRMLGPALGQIQENPQAAPLALLSQAGQIPPLLAMFAPVSKVSRNGAGEYGAHGDGTFVDLKPFVEQVFVGRLDLACMFLAECVKLEFGPFLSSAKDGALASLLAKI